MKCCRRVIIIIKKVDSLSHRGDCETQFNIKLLNMNSMCFNAPAGRPTAALALSMKSRKTSFLQVSLALDRNVKMNCYFTIYQGTAQDKMNHKSLAMNQVFCCSGAMTVPAKSSSLFRKWLMMNTICFSYWLLGVNALVSSRFWKEAESKKGEKEKVSSLIKYYIHTFNLSLIPAKCKS